VNHFAFDKWLHRLVNTGLAGESAAGGDEDVTPMACAKFMQGTFVFYIEELSLYTSLPCSNNDRRPAPNCGERGGRRGVARASQGLAHYMGARAKD
jgi:hypothetical protein